MALAAFDPNQTALYNNCLFGLPFNEAESKVVILPVPWDVTTSYNAGAAKGPEQILEASYQIDLGDIENKNPWKNGFYLRPIDNALASRNNETRSIAEQIIHRLAQQETDLPTHTTLHTEQLAEVNRACLELNNWVYHQCKHLIANQKMVGLLGGDHSTPLGYLQALSEVYPDFGILQIDAHCDLRKAYQGFKFSHASIMYNALEQLPQIKKLVQIGIRDFCEDELKHIQSSKGRIVTHFDRRLKERLYEGDTWKKIVDEIIDQLPQHTYISFDIDGLDPKLCPNTGTPVHGGFEVEQMFYLFSRIKAAKKQLIGFDLCEVAASETSWDANVGARVLYFLASILV